MLFGWWVLKRNGQPQKPLKRRPYFFCVPCGLWPRVRFCTVEALCRYVLSHSTPPFSSSSLIREVHCGKSNQSPAVMQKVRGRHDPPQPFELKNFSLCFPRFAPPAPKNSFRPIISVSSRPPTLLHTRSPCCTNLPSTLFPPQAPPKSLSWFGTHGLRPCKTATKMSDAIHLRFCHPLPCSFVAPRHKITTLFKPSHLLHPISKVTNLSNSC